MPRTSRPPLAVLVPVSAVLGFVLGVLATFKVQAGSGTWFPYDLVLAIVLAAALALMLRLVAGGRAAAVAGGVGELAAALVLTLPSRGGSVVLPLDAIGVVWLVGVAVATAAGALVPLPPERDEPAQEPDGILTATKGPRS